MGKMLRARPGRTRSALGFVMLVALAGCGGGAPKAAAPAGPGAPSGGAQSAGEMPPRPADAGADVAYYRERAGVLAKEELSLAQGTDFKRFRRGRLYLGHLGYPKELDDEIRAAVKKTDDAAVKAAAGKMLELDMTDIEAHMLLSVVEERAGRKPQSDFHRAVTIGLLDSIKNSGDGQDFGTAWVVFQVREEYQFLHVGGFDVNGQKLVAHAQRDFDVLDVTHGESGQKAAVYFDVTELLAEEGRMLSGP